MQSSRLHRLVALAALASGGGCVGVLGDYEILESPAFRPCSDDSDCAGADEGCDENHCARRCNDDDQCGQFTRCSLDFCSLPIGTPCADGIDCGGHCSDELANAQKTRGYCTTFCSTIDDTPCPAGYSCNTYCLKES